MSKYVVGMGEALWDVLPDGKKIGGAPANFAYHISQFGLPGYVVSAVGNDALGDEIISNFTAKKLNCIIERVPFPTGTVNVTIDKAGIPNYDITKNVAWDNIPFTPQLEALAKNTGAVCFGSLAQRNEVSRRTIDSFLSSMPKTAGTLTIFDINLRQNFYDRDILHSSMNKCNILKINDEELTDVSQIFNLPGNEPQDQCRALIERYQFKMLILTCGINGSYVFTGSSSSFMPTPKVTVADTVGAGDSFTAAFVASLLKGKSLTEAHATAVQTSAFVCTQNGAMPHLPHSIL